MFPRRAILIACLALLLALVFSAAALASPPAAPAAAPVLAPASESALITATGTAVIPASSTDFVIGPQTLNIGVQSRAAVGELAAAVAELQQRLLAQRSALEKVGVPQEGIRFAGLNVMPQYGSSQPGQPATVEKGQPPSQTVTGFMVSGSLQADIADVKLLVSAMNAATTNGATQVNVGGKAPPQQTGRPDDAALAKGMSDAIANARAVAAAIAAASGKTLGGVHSISANQLYPTCCPPQGGWNVQVTVSFDIATP